MGCTVQAYTTQHIPLDVVGRAASSALNAGSDATAVVCFSPSGVAAVKHICSTICVSSAKIAIGKTTAAAMLDAGCAADAIASTPSAAGVVQALTLLHPPEQAASHTAP